MAQDQINLQQSFWNDWNARTREQKVEDVSERHRSIVLSWMRDLGRADLEIIDVGCGAGWLCESLLSFGSVVGTDLADEVLARAGERLPRAAFVAGDFMALEFPENHFDVVVTLEVLSHVDDQPAFIAKLARLLKPGGVLMLVTQNRTILELNYIPPPAPGQIRRWVNRRELAALLAPHFEVEEMRTVMPTAERGVRWLLTRQRVRRLARRVVGDAYERWMESMGWGWSIVCRARARA